MSRLIRVFLCVALCGGCVLAADPLESTTWKIKAIATDAGKDFDDLLTFKGSQFSDEFLTRKGFKPAAYDDAVTRMGPATFEVTIESPASGKVKWIGSVTADQMTGTLAWTKADGSVTNYSFSGERASRK